MATKTFEELKQLAIQIRDEKTNKQNTATRIGTQMLEHLNKLEQDYYDKTATDEELKQRDEKLTELSSELRNNANIFSIHSIEGYWLSDGNFNSDTSKKVGFQKFNVLKGRTYQVVNFENLTLQIIYLNDNNEQVEYTYINNGTFTPPENAVLAAIDVVQPDFKGFLYIADVTDNNILTEKIKQQNKLIDNMPTFKSKIPSNTYWDNLTKTLEKGIVIGNIIDANVVYGIAWKCKLGDNKIEVYRVKNGDTTAQVKKIAEFSLSQDMTEGHVYYFLFDAPITLDSEEYIGIVAPIYYATSNTNYTRFSCSLDGRSYQVADNVDIGISPITIPIFFQEDKISSLKGLSFSVEGDSTSSWNGLPSVSNPYYPKGDVNSEDKMWWSVLKKLSGMSICRINAIGGSTVTKVNGSNTEMSNPARYLDLKSNGTEGDAPDVIILKGSINDWNSTVEMGTYEDDYLAVTDKFIPAYRGLLYHLQETYTNSMIFCCTPIKSFRDVTNYYPPTKNGLELTMFVDAIKKCASLHGVRCIDLYNNININQLNVDYKLYDKTLHPAAITMKEIGTYIFNSILQSWAP